MKISRLKFVAPGVVRALPEPPKPRACDECTLCCKVLAVQELDKPKDKWCGSAKKNTGCGCYTDRPKSCADFTCSWLDGMLAVNERPDKIHGVLCVTEDGVNLVLHEDTGWPGYASQAIMHFIARVTGDGKRVVIVVCGDARKIYGNQDLVTEKLKLWDAGQSIRAANLERPVEQVQTGSLDSSEKDV